MTIHNVFISCHPDNNKNHKNALMKIGERHSIETP